jgi:phosphoenolpyruvate-protein phosphotransferase
MVTNVSDIRKLLRHLRKIMARQVSAQKRLDIIVNDIARYVASDVCSLYVIQDDGTLELYATEGLKKTAVHQTRLQKNEGLVGLVAQKGEPVIAADARLHPAFSYRPETGEEALHSFLGVPLLKAGNVLGVLVIQSREPRQYRTEEIEGLEITAMALSEILATAELQSLAPRGIKVGIERPIQLKGTALAPGIGLGQAVLHEPRIIIKNVVAANPEKEIARLETALSEVRISIDRLLDKGSLEKGSEQQEIMETFRMFAYDPGWLRRLREAVLSGLTAEAAVERVQSELRARLTRQNDAYFKDRFHDLEDLARRLLHHLVGNDLDSYRGPLPRKAIIIARSMGPAALLDYDRECLNGLVLEEGGATSHVVVVARAMGIPVVSEVTNVTTAIETGQTIIVDGMSGNVEIRPKSDVKASYIQKILLHANQQKKYRDQRDVSAISKDGVAVSLLLNAGLPIDFEHVIETGAQGIGLFRTELQFMIAERMPSTNEQQMLYEQAFAAIGKKRPITFRTLDVGGDKILPYMPITGEENPALGWRAIRIGLDRPGLLRAQIRALLRAAAGQDLKILFPMAANCDEFLKAKQIAETERTYLKSHHDPLPNSIQYGAMVEVPALLFQLDQLCQIADFISVGSNDLLQFLFAADRENQKVVQRYDTLDIVALRVFKRIIDATNNYRIPVTLCGEMAGRPLEALTLIALGFHSLSMASISVGPVKFALLEADIAEIRNRLDRFLKQGSGSFRNEIRRYAEENSITLQDIS